MALRRVLEAPRQFPEGSLQKAPINGSQKAQGQDLALARVKRYFETSSVLVPGHCAFFCLPKGSQTISRERLVMVLYISTMMAKGSRSINENVHIELMRKGSRSSTTLQGLTSTHRENGRGFHMRDVKRSSRSKKWKPKPKE